MEDVKEPYIFIIMYIIIKYSFNPCFNGRCKRTGIIINTYNELLCFNPCFNGRCKRTCWKILGKTGPKEVSILVLMEDVKEQEQYSIKQDIE